jgi:hypothetical protein
MRSCLFIFSIFMVSVCYAESKNYAIEASVQLANDPSLYFPIPTMSFSWLKNKGNHEISAEFYTATKGSPRFDSAGEEYYGFGLLYSFLFKMPIKYLFVGPSIGVMMYSSEKRIIETTDWGSTEINYLDKYGQYYCGIKTGFIFGERTIRLKLLERLMVGIKQDMDSATEYGIFNSISCGILIAL